jgi:hypothetical protein
MPNAGSITYWYLQLPNLVLLAMILLLFARLILSPLLGSSGLVMRPVWAVTQPVVVAVGAITPRIVPRAGVILCAIIWLFAVRVALFMAASAMGVRL